MSLLTTYLEPSPDGTLHVPVPDELRHATFKVTIEPQPAVSTEAVPESEMERRRQLVALFEKLAESNPFKNIDPVEWQREMREDRVLLQHEKE